MGGNKGSALAVLLVLVVALGFFAGQSSARSWIDFASLIQGGAAAESTDEVCKDCDCPITGGCVCYDTFASCPSICSGCWCSKQKAECQCVNYVEKNWCAAPPATVQKKLVSDALY
ncbi:unnamed protein product [Miscanthus lutarioriparius]|uniref:Uncharacterized protein n=1 Tax=Miscanthus lutarioriparius TaxID=422564 RepID=A0A811RPL5_9POAL|nr:unnamed protein product [Miscanthus lutarioriparius]